VAPLGLVARGCKAGHGGLTVDFRAGCSNRSMTNNSTVNNALRNGCELLKSASAALQTEV